MFERPRCRRIGAPAGQVGKQGDDGAKILEVVGPKVQAGALPHPAGDFRKETWQQQPVFVMALFGPWIGEKDPEFIEGDPCWQRIDGFPGLSLDEVAVCQAGAFCFAFGAADPVADQVDSEEDPLRKFRGVLREEVSMAGPDLEGDDGMVGDEGRQGGAQIGLALFDSGKEFRFWSHGTF